MPSNLDVLSSSLLGVLDQQARMLLVLSAHAQALSASEEDVRISKLLVKCTEDDASASLRSAVKIIQTRQDQLSTWMEAILSTARMHREQIAQQREELLVNTISTSDSSKPLILVGEHSAAKTDLTCSGGGHAKAVSAEQGSGDTPFCSDASSESDACGHDSRASAAFDDSSESATDRSESAADTDARSDSTNDHGHETDVGRVIRLNVGGQLFCTTLDTLRAEESMLSSMFSGRFEIRSQLDGVFIDRDGTHFRHILNYLRGNGLRLGRDPALYNAVLDEADFYGLRGLQQLLRDAIEQLQDRGERLRRLSMTTAIEHTNVRSGGVFDDLLGEVYGEVEEQAARGKRECVIGFVQEKRVRGSVFRSQESGFWDRSLLNPRLANPRP